MTISNHNLFNDIKHKYILFVDNVVTTGATAHAAFQALRSPKYYETWAIAYTSTQTNIYAYVQGVKKA